jgi:large subunit ribosomal protein L13e
MSKAVVVRKVKGIVKKRLGRGFSLGELRQAGITVHRAGKLGLYVDRRRKTVHEENVKKLKALLS